MAQISLVYFFWIINSKNEKNTQNIQISKILKKYMSMGQRYHYQHILPAFDLLSFIFGQPIIHLYNSAILSINNNFPKTVNCTRIDTFTLNEKRGLGVGWGDALHHY